MARRAALRASDAEREEIAERLRHATAEGRLLAEELEERLERALTARTHGELNALVADLPGSRVARGRQLQLAPRTLPAIAAAILVAALAVVVVVALALVLAGLAFIWAIWLGLSWWLLRGRRAALARRSHSAARPSYGRRHVYGPRRL